MPLSGDRRAGAGSGDAHGARAELDREIRDRLRRFGATAGLWVTVDTGGRRYERDAGMAVPAECYARLFMWIELLRRVHEGALDPEARRRIQVPGHLRDGAPVFRHLADEPELTVMDCGRLMMLFDDAVAREVVAAALAAGRSATAGPDPAPAGGADPARSAARATTVRDVGVTLARAVRGTLIAPDASTAVLEILRELVSVDPSLAPGALPAGAVTGRLRAEGPGVLADASIIVLGDETVVTSLYVVQDPAERSGRQLADQLTGLLLAWALGAS